MSTEVTSVVQDTTNTTAETKETTSAQAVISEVKTEEVKAESVKSEEQSANEQVVKPEDNKEIKIEKYDLKLPEGSLLDQSKLAEIEAYAKDKNLSNEQAQDLLNREDNVLKSYQSSQQEMLAKSREDWKKQTVEDKEIGGENLSQNIEMAHRALKKFGSETLLKHLETTGLGNHPELVRAFMKVGRSMSEDKIVQANSSTSPKRSLEEIMYNNTKN